MIHSWGTLAKGQNGHSYFLIYAYLNILAQSQILVISLYLPGTYLYIEESNIPYVLFRKIDLIGVKLHGFDSGNCKCGVFRP